VPARPSRLRSAHAAGAQLGETRLVDLHVEVAGVREHRAVLHEVHVLFAHDAPERRLILDYAPLEKL